jgi:hypothetical protein
MDISSLESNKLDVAFLQEKVKYCPECYDGLLDGDETGIDCGGSCRPCGIERGWLWNLINGALILAALLLLIPILKMSQEERDLLDEIRALIKFGEESLGEKDRKGAENIFRKVKWLYIQMEGGSRKKIALKEIQNYYKKIKRFTEF